MTYKEYEIEAEAFVESGMYSLDDQGNLCEYKYEISVEPIIHSYAIVDKDGDIKDWYDSIAQCKEYIDNLA